MTDKQQPEALRLADALRPEMMDDLIATFEGAGRINYDLVRVELPRHQWTQLAAELRCLHAQVEALSAAPAPGVPSDAQHPDDAAQARWPAECVAAQQQAAPAGEIVVTKNSQGQIVAVTRQDKDGRVLSVIAESSAPAEGDAEQHENLLHCFFVMLGECEAKADNDNDPVLKLQVEGGYRLWNTVTGQAHQPRWAIRAATAAQKGGA